MEEIKDEKNKAAVSLSIWPILSSGSNKLKEENSCSSVTLETSGDIIAVINDKYNCICLNNESDQDKPLGGRQLKVQINNSEPITYTFDPSVKLKAGNPVTLYHPDNDQRYAFPRDLMWKDLKPWKSGARVQVSLQ
ncbi:lamin-A-like isoform X2 [Mugil cephalus]|uniref:lamin-A-like isoform X1 n=1 Tax=Mugil cephalus TaxID=48193 RepID=UPI001FB57B17|nr:lamin-A-like isoform X1 [Mugil cephalus]XP_047454978.1 lamin-A-like isoform X2 [Mugil cephalus]